VVAVPRGGAGRSGRIEVFIRENLTQTQASSCAPGCSRSLPSPKPTIQTIAIAGTIRGPGLGVRHANEPGRDGALVAVGLWCWPAGSATMRQAGLAPRLSRAATFGFVVYVENARYDRSADLDRRTISTQALQARRRALGRSGKGGEQVPTHLGSTGWVGGVGSFIRRNGLMGGFVATVLLAWRCCWRKRGTGWR